MISLREQLHASWTNELVDYLALLDEIEAKLFRQEFLPSQPLIMRALHSDISTIKVLVVGQDPYPNAEHAMGLAFSIPRGVESLPPTLNNIFKELVSDLRCEFPNHGDLSSWSNQGVMLLNRSLTLRIGEGDSHKDIGWTALTNEVAHILGNRGVAAILWGKKANELSRYFNSEKTLTSAHPSPLSAYRGFFGSRPFSRINKILLEDSIEPINWSL